MLLLLVYVHKPVGIIYSVKLVCLFILDNTLAR